MRRSTLVIRVVSTISLLVVITFAGIVWFNKVYIDPKNVFWGAISNNLTVAGITKETTKSSSISSQKQITQIDFTPYLRVHELKNLSYGQGAQATKLDLESVVTTAADYQRYSLIDRPLPTAEGTLDYSSIYKLWINSTAGQPGLPQDFTSALVDSVFYGDFNPAQRASLMSQLRKVYQVNLSSVDKTKDNGRRTYTYQVNLNLRAYAEAARAYANALGISQLSQIDPLNYSQNAQIKMLFTVDVLSRQLRQIEYVSSSTPTESFSAYGLAPGVSLPKTTVTTQVLETKLNSI